MNSIVRWGILALVSCCWATGEVGAQDRHQHKIDSLQTLLNGPQKEDGVARVATLLALGKVYMFRSDYVQAAGCYTNSLAIAEKINNDSMTALGYRNMAILHFYQHNYVNALDFDERARRIFEKRHDTLHTALQVKSMGDTHLQMGDTMRAATYYEQALALIIAAHDKDAEAELYANQSIVQHGDQRKAIALRLKAKTIWDQYPVDNVLPTINLGNLGEGYLDLVRLGLWETIPASDTMPHDRQRLLALGEGYLRAAIRMAHGNSDVEDSAYFTGVLAELEEQKGDFRHAYYDFRAYQTITDSIYSQENKNKIAKIEDAREIERKNQEIANKELQIANQHKKMWLLASCIALLAVTGGLLWRQGVIRKKSNAELRRLNVELDEANKVKARFFGILSHDLRSPVSRLVHFLQLQEMEPELLTPEEAGEQKTRLRSSAQVLLENMESVLLWSKGQMERFRPERSPVVVGELFSEVARLYPAQDGVSYRWRDEEKIAVMSDRNYLRSILYNLTANATRAVVGVADASIEWRAWTEDGDVRLAITDNGQGIRDTAQLAALFEETAVRGAGQGLGLHIIRDLARAIGARVEAEVLPGRGMRFVISIATDDGR